MLPRSRREPSTSHYLLKFTQFYETHPCLKPIENKGDKAYRELDVRHPYLQCLWDFNYN